LSAIFSELWSSMECSLGEVGGGVALDSTVPLFPVSVEWRGVGTAGVSPAFSA
jgi:hypothetical protein